MAANNCGVFIGRAGSDPDVRTTNGGCSIAKFSLAVDRGGKKDDSGNKITDWFRVSLWGKSAELASDLITKGKLISVCGSVNIDEWEKDGVKQKMVVINADNFQLLGSRDENSSGGHSSPAQHRQAPVAQTARAQHTMVQPTYPEDDSDIPPF